MNTTDLMITTFCDRAAINFINDKTGLDFRLISDGTKSGGSKVLSFEVYGVCLPCIGKEALDNVINIFSVTPFANPEYATLLINDDYNIDYNMVIGVNTHIIRK